jgi:hypothetical protein
MQVSPRLNGIGAIGRVGHGCAEFATRLRWIPQSGGVARAEAGWDGLLHLGALSILAIFRLLAYCSLAHCHEGRRHSEGISTNALERPQQTDILLPPVTSPVFETIREHSS